MRREEPRVPGTARLHEHQPDGPPAAPVVRLAKKPDGRDFHAEFLPPLPA